MRSRLASLLLLGLPVAALAAAPDPDYHARPLGASGDAVSIAVDFEAPEWVETTIEERVYRHLSWTGLFPEGEAGAPALPTALLRVAVPHGGPVSLTQDAVVRGQAGGVRFPPAPGFATPPPAREPGPRPDAAPRRVLREGTGFERTGPLPAVEILGEGVERGVRLVTLAVRPVTYNAATGDATWMSRVDVTLRVENAVPLPAVTRPSDRVSRADWLATVVNPEDAARFATRPGAKPLPTATGVPDVWFDDASQWLKIHITANGIYRLDAAALEAAGVSTTLLDPRQLRLFSGPLVPELGWTTLGWDSTFFSSGNFAGIVPHWAHVWDRPSFGGFGTAGGFQEVALSVSGEDDGRLDSGDEIVFYGLGPDNFRDRYGLPLDTAEDYLMNPADDGSVYWLALGESAPGAFPDAPRRMVSESATPVPGATLLTTSAARIHAEENHHYDPSLYQARWRWEEFFWDFFLEGDVPPPKTIPVPHVVPGSTLDARIRLWGAQVPTLAGGDASRHHIQVTINGSGCFSELAKWGGPSVYQAVTPQDVVAAGVCAEDPTRVAFASIPVTPPPGYSRFDKVQLAWIELTYRRTLHAAGGPAELEVDAGDPGRTMRVEGAPTGSLWLLDVTDFRNPRRLTNATRTGSAVEFSLAPAAGAVVALAGANQLRAPAAVALDTPPDGGWLRDAGSALDYVIVCDDAQVEAAEELAAWRRDHLYPYTPDRGANVRVVRVSDVMDEFAWGMWDPTALRYFLEYAYTYYDAESPDRLAYALFLGEHTYDPRDHLGTGVRDLMPSWENNRDDLAYLYLGNVQYVSDDPLAQFDGSADLYLDLYLGRITTVTGGEALELVRNKVIRSEESPVPGAWRTKAILVADDICQGRAPDGLGFGHMRQSETLAALLPPDFDVDKIYLYDYGEECVYDSKPEAKRALIASWSEGAWMVNYFGHGADVVLADEHVYDLSDTPTLANDGRLPIFGAFSCSVGKFNKPQFQGLAESLLRVSRTGALVAIGATQVTFSSGNERLCWDLYHEFFPTTAVEPASVGAALTRAERISAPGSERIDKKYVCFGDPGSWPSIPRLDLGIRGPTGLNRGEVVEIGIGVPGGQLRDGEVDVLVEDARVLRNRNSRGQVIPGYYVNGADLYRGTAAVAADTAVAHFVVPVSLRGGPDGRIRVYGEGDDWDGFRTLTPLPVGGLAPAGGDSTGPVITVQAAGGRVAPGQEVPVLLEDASGINLTQLFEFRSVLLKIFDSTGLEQLRLDLTEAFRYDEGSYTRGSVTFRVPDLTTGPYRFLLAATDNYNNRSEVATDVEVTAAAPGSGLSGVFAYPNPFDPQAGPTQVVLTLDRPASLTVHIYSVSGRLVRQTEVGAEEGRVSVPWDGRDAAGDPVSNGVYLVQITARPTGGGETARHLERVVVLR